MVLALVAGEDGVSILADVIAGPEVVGKLHSIFGHARGTLA